MANVWQYTALWNGFTGAPGYSRFYFTALANQTLIDSAGSALRTFFNALQPYLSTGWTVQIQQPVPYFDEVNGALLGEDRQTTQPLAVNGTSSTAIWSGGVGALCSWRTASFFNGHRVRGRTYLVPLRGQQDVDGTLLAAAQNTITSAANALITAGGGNFVVWSRVFSAPPKPQQINGTHSTITTVVVPDKTAVLRSRRD